MKTTRQRLFGPTLCLTSILLVSAPAFGRNGLQDRSERPVYLDPAAPIAQRVNDLLSRMTLEEKVGQMNMPCVYEEGLGRTPEEKREGCRRFAAGTQVEGLGPGGGFFTLPNTILHESAREQAAFLNGLQRIAVEQTRLGIPLLETEEGTHGLMCSDATIFPEGLALGSTFDLDLVSRIYRVAATEARSRGIHELFTLVVEPYRDPRLGRSQEGFSEDPWYCSGIARTIVRAVQGYDVSQPDRTVAGLCHYPGQSQPVSGLERGAMDISERMLRNVFLPPWDAGIRQSGALGVMATYPAVDGVPAHASTWLLTEILRQELGFRGLVLSEGGGIGTLVYEGLAADQKHAGILALQAGVDVGISYEDGYMVPLVESVRQGLVDEALVDRAVRRILEQKFRLGLFEHPYADPDTAAGLARQSESRDLALEAARKSIVLLKNEGDLLPLDRDRLRSIAVIGPNADNDRNQLGDYTPQHILQEITTVLDGIRELSGAGVRVDYLKGCEVIGDAVNEIGQAAETASRADVAVVVLGENEWQAAGRMGTSGEGFDVATLELTGRQRELVQAVVETGTPTVVVLLNGRPLAVRWIAAHVPAVLEAWQCGEMGGRAVAEILFGEVNPSGRLPVTVPRHVGQLPVYYNAPKSKPYWIEHGWGTPYADLDPLPLWPFGHGLSYTSFDYGELSIEPAAMGRSGEATVRFRIRNAGSRKGTEVVQLYVTDDVASVATPVRELRGIQRVELGPGEARMIEFRVRPSDLSLLDRHLERVVEPGTFTVQVGHSSADIRLKGILTVAAE